MANKPSNNNEQTPWLDADVIKARISIEKVLAGYGVLDGMKRKGNKLVGRSPFREDKKSSFSADLERNIWNDFGGKSDDIPGNVFGLIRMFENCSFREALVILNRRFIRDILESAPQQSERSKEPTASPKRTQSNKPTKMENVPFGRELKGRTNIPFLLDKGITEETIKEFRVVYCSAGLMKGRIAFPIRNIKGKVMAYAGRAVKKTDEEENGKYRFPPKFNKSIELFNIHRIAGEAKKAVKDFGIIVVEGFTDAMKLHQEGFLNVVALMGTDFHNAQKKMLLNPELNPTRRVTIFLDDDEAGHKGKRKIARDLINNGFVRYANWKLAPEGKTEPEHFVKEELVALLSNNNS